MALNIRIETFKPDGTHTVESPAKRGRPGYRYVYETGTVEVDLGNEVVTCRAHRQPDYRDPSKVRVSVAGFVGRYETSSKPWVASLWQTEGEEPQGHFGRDDRSGRFHKLRGISYEPKTYEAIANMPFWYPN